MEQRGSAPAQRARVALSAGMWAFCVYFCMYAFRKPFAATSYPGELLWGLEPKTALIIGQLVGYTASKYIGTKVVSEVRRGQRLAWILGLIVFAELSLVGFWLLPWPGKLLSLFCNGLPLGMIWGLVVMYLEGRRTSELALAALSCSFIVASGAVKDVGRWLIRLSVDPFAMPALTGAMFLPPLVVSALLLDRTPEPSTEDHTYRHPRSPMHAEARLRFLKSYLPGLALLFVVYVGLTAFRDFRDNYGAELFVELGYRNQPALFTLTELPVAAMVLACCASLVWFQDRIVGWVAVSGQAALGLALIPVAAFLLERRWLSGQSFMIAVGFGAYLAYVPFSSFLFDRLMAATRAAGTSVFAVNVADALGYTGSIFTLLSKDLFAQTDTRLRFFLWGCYAVGAVGALALLGACVYFVRVAQRSLEVEHRARAAESTPS